MLAPRSPATTNLYGASKMTSPAVLWLHSMPPSIRRILFGRPALTDAGRARRQPAPARHNKIAMTEGASALRTGTVAPGTGPCRR
jgi:hypothetical protein